MSEENRESMQTTDEKEFSRRWITTIYEHMFNYN